MVEGTDITDSDRWIGVSSDPMIREVMAGGRTAIIAKVKAGDLTPPLRVPLVPELKGTRGTDLSSE